MIFSPNVLLEPQNAPLCAGHLKLGVPKIEMAVSQSKLYTKPSTRLRTGGRFRELAVSELEYNSVLTN